MSHGPRQAAVRVEQLSDIGQSLMHLVDLAEALGDDADVAVLRDVILRAAVAVGGELESVVDRIRPVG